MSVRRHGMKIRRKNRNILYVMKSLRIDEREHLLRISLNILNLK
jgi:hypothetical protein